MRSGSGENGRNGKSGQSRGTRQDRALRRGKKKPQAEDKDSLEWLADQVQVPTEVLAGAPVFILNGRHQIWVENYKSILEYQDTLIRLQTRQGRVKICGRNLCINEFTRDGMRITGRILSVEFC